MTRSDQSRMRENIGYFFMLRITFILKGVHRNLGVHCSRARSLLMDEKIWNPALIEVSLFPQGAFLI